MGALPRLLRVQGLDPTMLYTGKEVGQIIDMVNKTAEAERIASYMIDNTTQWAIWCCGWGCLVASAYLYGKEPAALLVLGTGLLRASGIASDTSLSSLFSSLLTFLKPGVAK